MSEQEVVPSVAKGKNSEGRPPRGKGKGKQPADPKAAAKGKGAGAEKPRRKPSPEEEKIYKEFDVLNSEYDRLRGEKAEIQKNIRLKNDALQASESGKLATQGNLGELAKRIQKAEGLYFLPSEDLVKTEAELEKAKKEQEGKYAEAKRAKDKLEIKVTDNAEQNLKLIDEKVKALETRISTESLSLKDEKELLAQIGRLKKSKQDVKEYEQKLQQVKKGSSIGFFTKKKEKNVKRIETLRKQYNEDLEKLKAEPAAKTDSEIPGFEAKLKEVEDNINNVLSQIRQAKENLVKAKADAKAAEQAKWEAQQAAKKEKWEKLQKERAERQQARLQKELDEVPLGKELDDCEFLLVYLRGLIGEKTAEKQPLSSGKAIAKPKGGPRKVETPADSPAGNFLQKQKGDDASDFFGFAAPEKKKKPAPAAAAAPKASAQKPKDDTLTHSIATLNHFAKVDLKSPLRLSDVPASIKEVEAKFAEYKKKSDELQAKKVAEFAEREAKAKAAAEPSVLPEALTAAPAEPAPAAEAAESPSETAVEESTAQ